jgi:hypothetical protein
MSVVIPSSSPVSARLVSRPRGPIKKDDSPLAQIVGDLIALALSSWSLELWFRSWLGHLLHSGFPTAFVRAGVVVARSRHHRCHADWQ